MIRNWTAVRKRTDVNVSQELLAYANISENLLAETSKQEMRHGLRLWCQNQSTTVAVTWESIIPAKKVSTSWSNMKVTLVFLLERYISLLICTKWSDSKQRLLHRSFKTFEGLLYAELGCEKIRVGCYAITTCQLMPYLSCGKTPDNHPVPPTLLSRLGPTWLFNVTKIEGNL